MATFLDVTGLQNFSIIFVFLFVWLVVYAVLTWIKVVGDNKIFNVGIGLLLAIFVVISPLATDVIASIAPFIAVVLLFVVLLNVALSMLGGNLESFHMLKGIFFVVILGFIFVAAGTKVREQVDMDETPTDFSKTVNLVFHPKFLGTVLIFAIAVFTVALMASKSA